jgi:hypothetical protein
MYSPHPAIASSAEAQYRKVILTSFATLRLGVQRAYAYRASSAGN